MKKLMSVLLIGTAVVLNSCQKEAEDTSGINDVSTVQRSLVIDFTATWCGPCGDYGIPTFHKAFDDHPYKVCGLSAHSGDLTNNNKSHSVVDDLSSFYNVSGIPTFVEGVKSYTQYKDQFNTAVGKTVAPGTATVGVGLSTSISGNTMTVKTKTVFFSEGSGEYNVAVYLTEDGIVAKQNMNTEDHHNHVLRAAGDGKTWGKQVATGTVVKGSKFDGTYTINLESSWKQANLHVVGVIYKMQNGKPVTFVNTNSL